MGAAFQCRAVDSKVFNGCRRPQIAEQRHVIRTRRLKVADRIPLTVERTRERRFLGMSDCLPIVDSRHIDIVHQLHGIVFERIAQIDGICEHHQILCRIQLYFLRNGIRTQRVALYGVDADVHFCGLVLIFVALSLRQGNRHGNRFEVRCGFHRSARRPVALFRQSAKVFSVHRHGKTAVQTVVRNDADDGLIFDRHVARIAYIHVEINLVARHHFVKRNFVPLDDGSSIVERTGYGIVAVACFIRLDMGLYNARFVDRRNDRYVAGGDGDVYLRFAREQRERRARYQARAARYRKNRGKYYFFLHVFSPFIK